MKNASHFEVEYPLDSIDNEAQTWMIKDRIDIFVNIHLSLHENLYYLQGHIVEDEIATV